AILVTANVKDERPGRRRIVRGRERLLEGGEVRPIGIPQDFEDALQRPPGGRMLSCELCHRRFAIDLQRLRFPYLGTFVKGSLAVVWLGRTAVCSTKSIR